MYRLGAYLWRTLLDTSTPLWVTFAGVLLSAYGAYAIAPAINNELEKQKIKTEFVIRNLDSLNGKTQELFSEISIVNRKILSGEKNYGENIDKATRLSTELQWKAIELGAILQDQESRKIILKFQRTLDDFHTAMIKINSAASAAEALEKLRIFVPSSLAVTKRIADLSGIKFE